MDPTSADRSKVHCQAIVVRPRDLVALCSDRWHTFATRRARAAIPLKYSKHMTPLTWARTNVRRQIERHWRMRSMYFGIRGLGDILVAHELSVI